MTSLEIPYSVAAALPSLVVLDLTNEVRHEVERSELEDGIAFVSPGTDAIVRVNEREAGFFDDVERMLGRLVPHEDESQRGRLLSLLLGARTEQVPFVRGTLCLGQWQRILLFSFSEEAPADWALTLVG